MRQSCECPCRGVPDHCGPCPRTADRTVLRVALVLRVCAACYLPGDLRLDQDPELYRL